MKYILFFILLLTISCDNANVIWKYLVKSLTKEGAAGLMGTLYAKSNLESAIYEKAFHSKIGLSDLEYVNRVNSGVYSKESFINDGAGFGLAQWKYYSKKESLYEKCFGQIGNINCQLNFLLYELEGDFAKLLGYLKSSHDLMECTSKVVREYDRPLNADLLVNQRYQYALGFYNRFNK